MSLRALGRALCLVLAVFVAACGADESGKSGDGLESGGEMTGGAEASGGASETGGMAISTECGCDASVCGAVGQCLCDRGEALCLCDAGYAGRTCDSCQPGYTRVDGRCRLSLSEVEPEPAGDDCPAGGVVIRRGTDTDGNGQLDPSEVEESDYVCNAVGSSGSVCTGADCCSPELCGAAGSCVQGLGSAACICSAGTTGARCDACAVGYVATGDGGSCQPAQRLTVRTPTAPGAPCPTGGDRVRTGLDLNGDGLLSDAEVDSEALDCTGARVLSGDFVVTTQAQLDNLRGVTEIDGSLTIEAPFVQDFSPLTSLIRMSADLVLRGCDDLTDLRALARLSAVGGSLHVAGNAQLADLSGLSGLTTVVGDLRVADNAALQSLSGLEALHAVGGTLALEGNPVLSQLGALSAVVELGGLRVSGNATLPNLDGLGAVRAVLGDVVVADNPALSAIDSLSQLEAVGGHFTLTGNGALASLTNFGAMADYAGALTIAGSPQLTAHDLPLAADMAELRLTDTGFVNLDGFAGLKSLTVLVIADNAALTDIALSELHTVVERIEIRGNASLKQLDGFSALTTLGGERMIPSATGGFLYPGYGSTLGYSGGGLVIMDNDALVGISGFPLLNSVGAVYIVGNDALAELDSFTQAIEVVGWCRSGFLVDYASTSLVDKSYIDSDELGALTFLADILYSESGVESYSDYRASPPSGSTVMKRCIWSPKELQIRDNASLTSVTAFANTSLGVNLTGYPTYTGHVELHKNPSLTELQLPESVVNTMGLSENPLLALSPSIAGGLRQLAVTQDGLSFGVALPAANLTVLELQDNPGLTDLSTLLAGPPEIERLGVRANGNLATMGTSKPRIRYLTVTDNPKLPDCDISRFVNLTPQTPSTSSYLTVSGNDPNSTCP